MNIAKTPRIVKSLFSKLTWQMLNDERKIYLTFDDGPIPGVTEWVLDLLDEYNIKATFFCVGENVVRHPEVYQNIKDQGHSIGNHTYNHMNGWKCSVEEYLDNVAKADSVIQSKLFRPPHGRIKRKAIGALMPHYEIIMWDVLSVDYDANVSPESCLKNVTSNVQAGSIIVFHDSLKAERNLRYALPKCIEYLQNEGYSFHRIEEPTH